MGLPLFLLYCNEAIPPSAQHFSPDRRGRHLARALALMKCIVLQPPPRRGALEVQPPSALLSAPLPFQPPRTKTVAVMSHYR